MKFIPKYYLLLILLILSNFIAINCDDKKDEATEESPDGFTKEDRELLKKNEEKFNFNVEVTRMMYIIINSLYTNKEVFIRELISNASDACDKARFLAVQNPDYFGENKELKIIIETDRASKTFSITDTGVGMTKNDLVKNLGTIAKSGTTSFIEAISKGNSLNLIGQFGVGFYSTYLVSNKVVVTSKNADDNQHVWVSTAGSSFTVAKDPRGNTLGRGTKITLFLKEDSVEFCETDTVKKNIKKYSEFIDYPIYMKINKTYTEEEEIDEPENETETTSVNETKKDNKTDDLEIKDEDEEKKKEKKKKTKSITKWKWDYELINENKPIWLRDKKEITKEEYVKFYKALTKDSEEPLAYEHGKLEGEVNFRYILFIPGKRPYDLYDNYYGKSSSLKLYVRRVLVSEQFEDLMPRYLNFIKGVVDSDDLPLNVSREALQQYKMIKVMSNKLVKASIQIMIKLAVEKEEDEDDDDEDDEDDEEDNETESKNETETKKENDTKSDDEEDDEKEEKTEKKKDTKYMKFFENYGKNIKLGVIEDIQNRNKLAKLLRFYSTHNIDELTSFDEYIKRMKPKQEQIYFLAGEDKAAVAKSPLIQKILEKGGEVFILDDPIDEFCLQNLGEYEKKKLKNVAKGEFKLWEDDDELAKKKEKKIEKDFKPLIEWWKKLLGAKVENIIVSQRLVDSPCIMIGTEHGYSASMERIQKAQAFANQDKITAQFLYARKTMEINPNHPAIKTLKEQVGTSDKVSEDVEDTAMLLFESAMLESGYSLPDPHAFGVRMEKVLKYNLGLSRDEKVSPYEVVLDDNDDDDDDKKDDDDDKDDDDEE
jgi:heat shock protein beta